MNKEKELRETVAKNLVFLREKLGKTRDQVCIDNNLSYTALQSYERGDRLPSKLSTLNDLANYYGISLDQLTKQRCE